MLSREIILNELRKVRNDLIFLSMNLFYPKDIDHGPTEEMIDIDGTKVPKFTKIVKIPIKEGEESAGYRMYNIYMNNMQLYLARLESVDIKQEETNITFEELINPAYTKLLHEGETLRNNVLEMVPKNFNRELAQMYGYIQQLLVNYSAMNSVNNYLKGFEFTDDFRNMTISCSKNCRGRKNQCTICSTEVPVKTISEWLESCDNLFENGMFMVTMNSLFQHMRSSIMALGTAQSYLSRFNSVSSSELSIVVSKMINDSIVLENTDFHLERSKCPFKPIGSTTISVDTNTDLVCLPYPYVHGDSGSSYEDYNEESPTIGKKPNTIEVSTAIGDITEFKFHDDLIKYNDDFRH